MSEINCEFCLNAKAVWRCVDCGLFMCNSCIDKKFSIGRFLAKSALSVATMGGGIVSFSSGKGVSKGHKCIRCESNNVKKIG